jgi:hypothetical protein
MIKTYTETPDFGDATKFQKELDLVSQKVHKLEQELTTLNRDLDLVESKMNLNMRHSLLTSPSRSLLSVNTSSSISSTSIRLGFRKDPLDVEESHENKDENGENVMVEQNVQAIIANHYVNKSDTSEDMNEVNSDSVNTSNDDDDEFETENPKQPIHRLMTLYSYEGTEEGTLSMELGDEFEVLGTDCEGWIKVRRAGFIEEGFIPTAFTQSL